MFLRSAHVTAGHGTIVADWRYSERVLLLIAPIVELFQAVDRIGTILGPDRMLYLDATSRWLSGGPFYPDYELSGPFENTDHDVLYPPNAILLFAPFTILPAALWWAIPAVVVAWVTLRLRPDPIVWPFVAICLAWRATPLTIVVGNPVLFGVAALALATLYRWPAALIPMKPSVFPVALFGVWRRSWWLALAGLVLVSIPFGEMWLNRCASSRTHGSVACSTRFSKFRCCLSR